MMVKVNPGTQRSWDREVGYGVAPDWYLEPQKTDSHLQKFKKFFWKSSDKK